MVWNYNNKSALLTPPDTSHSYDDNDLFNDTILYHCYLEIHQDPPVLNE